jgi:hypothetical protein
VFGNVPRRHERGWLWRLQGSEVFAKRTAQPTPDHPRKANDEESRSKGDEDGVCNSDDLKAGRTALTRLAVVVLDRAPREAQRASESHPGC